MAMNGQAIHICRTIHQNKNIVAILLAQGVFVGVSEYSCEIVPPSPEDCELCATQDDF